MRLNRVIIQRHLFLYKSIIIINNNRMVSDGKTNGREQHLGLFINPFQSNRFFSRSMGQIFPVRSHSIIQNRINERFLIVFGIHAIFTRPMNTYSISTWWIIESFVISLHEYFMRNFIGDFWLNFVAVLEKHIIKV